jgi:hypothetical protein
MGCILLNLKFEAGLSIWVLRNRTKLLQKKVGSKTDEYFSKNREDVSEVEIHICLSTSKGMSKDNGM